MTLTICSAGIDSLYVSFPGKLDVELLGRLKDLRLQAQADGAPVPVPADEAPRLVVHPNGTGHYRYWLQSSDFQVLVARGGKLPPVYLKLSSAYLHQLGPIAALHDADIFVRDVLQGQLGPAQASRLDLYVDFQGWIPSELDFRRCVTRARRSVEHFEAVQAYFDGQRFTGYQFGRDQLVGRLYDKGREAVTSGKAAWMREVWGPRLDAAVPMWRLEFQLRREAIATFNVRTAEEAISCRQDFGVTARLSGSRCESRQPIDSVTAGLRVLNGRTCRGCRSDSRRTDWCVAASGRCRRVAWSPARPDSSHHWLPYMTCARWMRRSSSSRSGWSNTSTSAG